MKHENDEHYEMLDDKCSWCGASRVMVFTASGDYCSNRCKDRAKQYKNVDE